MTPMLAEIRMFAGNFAPRDWAFCDGQILSIAQHTALFSLLGTTYGGNGTTTFGLPDLRGRFPLHPGTGPGLSPRSLGQIGGGESTTLLLNNLPSHSHTATVTPASQPCASAAGNTEDPAGNYPAINPDGDENYNSNGGQTMGPLSGGGVQIGATGGNQPFSTMSPFLGVNFIIALNGIFPSRN